jgi:hypothetical protein
MKIVRENGRYWIVTPNGPLWNIDERGVDLALSYLFGKRKQEQCAASCVIFAPTGLP